MIDLGFVPLALLLAGLALGLAYFAALRRSVALLGGGSPLAAAALTLGRLGAAALLFWAAARLGAPALLLAAIGFLLARGIALHRLRRAS